MVARLCERFFFFLTAGFLALWTVLAQLFTLGGGTLRGLFVTYAVCAGTLLALLGIAGARALHRRRPKLAAGEVRVLVGLGALALAGGLLALFAIRPDRDQVNVVARTVWFLEHSTAPLDLALHNLAYLEPPLVHPVYLAHTIEHFWGFWSWLLGVPFLDVYHRSVPFAVGLAIPLAWYLVLSRFAPERRHALAGTAAVFAYLCIDGSSHQSFGNFGFVRIWQGKTILLALVTPLFVAFSLAWLRAPSPRGWLALFALATAASGMSSTALFYLPLLTLFIALGHLAAEGFGRATLLRLAGYGASLAYLLALAFHLWLVTGRESMEYLGFAAGSPLDFGGQLRLVFPPEYPIGLVALTAASAAALAWASRAERRFLAGWLLAAFVLALNPLAMPLVAELTTYNTYWRVFYALPFPLVIGLAVAFGARGSGLRARGCAALASALLVAAAIFNAVEPGRSTFGWIEFAPDRHKVRSTIEADVLDIIEHAQPGPMLAPWPYATLIGLLTNAHPQVVVDGFMVRHFTILRGVPEVGESRVRAQALTLGAAGGLEDLEVLLAQGLPNLVLIPRVARRPPVRRTLRAHGLELVRAGPRHAQFARVPDGERRE